MGSEDQGHIDRPLESPDQTGEQSLRPFQLAELDSKANVAREPADIELDLRIQLGQTSLSVTRAMQLRHGSVIPLDETVEQPVDIYVNEHIVARGDILILDGNFCVRVTELVSEKVCRKAG